VDDPRDLPLPLDEDDIHVLHAAAWTRENRPENEIKTVANLTAYVWEYAHGPGVELQDVQDLLSLLVEAFTGYPVWAFQGYDGDDEILNRGREIFVTQTQQLILAELKNLPDRITIEDLELRTRAVAERIFDALNQR
jgi:hypothetical protein